MKLIKIIMPSQGDMELVRQDGGSILLRPTYFGGECAGPVIQYVDVTDSHDPQDILDIHDVNETVASSYRVRIKRDGELRLAKAD